MKAWNELTNKQKAEQFMKDMPNKYKVLGSKELKKLFMHCETYMHKQLTQNK